MPNSESNYRSIALSTVYTVWQNHSPRFQIGNFSHPYLEISEISEPGTFCMQSSCYFFSISSHKRILAEGKKWMLCPYAHLQCFFHSQDPRANFVAPRLLSILKIQFRGNVGGAEGKITGKAKCHLPLSPNKGLAPLSILHYDRKEELVSPDIAGLQLLSTWPMIRYADSCSPTTSWGPHASHTCVMELRNYARWSN